MNFVLVNHRMRRGPSCAVCGRPLERGYVHDLFTHDRYCGAACYRGRTSGSFSRSVAKADAFELVIMLIILPKFAIDVVCAAFDFA